MAELWAQEAARAIVYSINRTPPSPLELDLGIKADAVSQFTVTYSTATENHPS